MSDTAVAIVKIIIGAAAVAGYIGATVWMTKNGSPQHIWLFCDMLGWCRP